MRFGIFGAAQAGSLRPASCESPLLSWCCLVFVVPLIQYKLSQRAHSVAINYELPEELCWKNM
jgi:hypothetical protein